MRKILLVSMLLASLGAGAQGTPAAATRLNFTNNWVIKKAPSFKLTAKAPASLIKQVRRADDATEPDIIYGADGEEKNYYRKTRAYYVDNDNTYWADLEGAETQITFGSNDSVYFYNPITQFPTYSYMAGKQVGDTIYISTPQPIYQQWNEDYTETTTVYITKYRKHMLNADQYNFVPDSIDTTVKYVIKDGTIELVDGDSVMIGLGNSEKTWGGYGNMSDTMEPFNDTELTIPDGVETQTYSMVSADASKGVNVAFDGDKVYVQGFSSSLPDGVIEGTIEGDSITFPSFQYLGVNTDYHFYFYFVGARTDTVYEDGEGYLEYTLLPEVKFAYDKETGTFSTDKSILTNAGKGVLSYDESYDKPVFSKFNDVPATPADPIIDYYMPYNDDSGYGGLMFVLPTEDNDGNWINPENMTYEIYLDDNVLEFTPDTYMGLEENMTEVPYYFTDDMDFSMQDGEHVLYFYEQGFNRLGVQSIYRGGGERRVSNIVYTQPSGINGVNAGSKAVSTEVYDLSGRRVTTPQHGIYILRQKLDNGNTVVRKVMK